MTHLIQVQHFITGLRTSIESLHLHGFARNILMFRLGFKHHYYADLNPHLRYDSGEDDMRPQAQQTLLQHEAEHANSLDTMLLRSF